MRSSPRTGSRSRAGRSRCACGSRRNRVCPKAFCADCGGQLYSDGGDFIVVRLGLVDGDPGIEPEWRQWLESSPPWAAIPDDGLRRFQQRRTA